MTSYKIRPEMYTVVLNPGIPNPPHSSYMSATTLAHNLPASNTTQSQVGECNKKYSKIQDGLESSISLDGRARITRILNEIQCLTDVEKLLLYLKLPTGIVQEDPSRLTPPSCLPTTSNRREQGEAVTWIKSHLEEYGEVCMPKAEVYDEYRQYCEQHELRPLCNADFGKMMKHVFPDINTRRLGQRGQSKYFYGGLRKKTEHTPPMLPELEVHSKTIEIDSNIIDNEIFKASCQLVCEWADKLLEAKFLSVQSVAEHLVRNVYVNTKSVPAFTLIASMQDLKGSPLVSSQSVTCGDKHKETNLLLQQKLHKNKVLQKQKEKLQAMKDDMEQQQQTSATTTPSLDRRTPNTPTRKPSTPSRTSKTPKLPSPSPSPLPLQSPRKFEPQPSPLPLQSPSKFKFQCQSKQDPATKDLFAQPLSRPLSVSSDNSVCKPMAQTSKGYHRATSKVSNVEKDAKKKEVNTEAANANTEVANGRSYSTVVKNMIAEAKTFEKIKNEPGIGSCVKGEKEGNYNRQAIVIDTDYEMGSPEIAPNQVRDLKISSNEMADQGRLSSEKVDLKIASNQHVEMVFNEAETPVSEMEMDQASTCHVRKINFDDLIGPNSEALNKLPENSSLKTENESERKKKSGAKTKVNKELKSSDDLSKSDGHLSLKMLLERKGDHQSILNKSLGFLEKSKNALFVNQSNGRFGSAFVPVPSRKDNTNVSQSISTSIPIIIPSSTQAQMNQSEIFTFESMSQPTNITVIAVPNSITPSQINFTPASQRVPDNIIKILPGRSETNDKNILIQSSFSESQPHIIVTSMKSLPTETLTVAMGTVSSAVSSSNEAIMSSAQISPNVAHHSKAPRLILPRPSPNKKESPVKETKGENPVYDKRPVSVILKEKRAKDQAEAMAKLASQASMKLPTIPFQSSISLNRNQLGSLQGIAPVASSVPPKEVVIIVNNQSGSANLGTVLNPSTLVTHPIMSTGSAKIRDNQCKNLSKATSSENPSAVTIDLTSDYQNYSNAEHFSDSCLSSNIETSESMDLISGSNFENGTKQNNTPNFNNEIAIQRDVTPILSKTVDERDLTPILGDMEVDEDRLEIQNTFIQPTISETSYLDKLEILNITSPIRSDSTCSLGRETPGKIHKASDSCHSRPESACSYGRETPSGGRKRKSSDFPPRKDFKRLNSTGDEGDDSLKDVSAVLSPENELHAILNPRRTQSCTFELDKDMKHGQQHKPYNMLKGLQSPDISCLEEEVLRETYMFEIPPLKLQKLQTSSVGVGAGSRRHSQQKLIKQQEYLDQRVNKFLQKDACPLQKEAEHFQKEVGVAEEFTEEGNEIQTLLERDDHDVLVAKDSVQKKEGVDIEPSGLPSFIADFINENMEKRNSKKQSVISEPDLNAFNQQSNLLADSGIPNFRFEVDHDVSKVGNNNNRSAAITGRSASQNAKLIIETSQKKTLQSPQDDTTFMVPKVPAFSSRGKDSRLAVTTDTQRCQSLPTFTSPIQSPVSPVAGPVGRRNIIQRATSMSPRSQHTDVQVDLLAPIKNRIEVRENHPISVTIHPTKHRDDSTLKQGNFVVRPNLTDQSQNQIGTYLKSIQHNLQMPRESFLDQHDMKSREILGQLDIKTKDIQGEKFMQYTLPSNSQTLSRESSVDRITSHTPEHGILQIPFSDSGYHSTGHSPVLNSTPVSGILGLEVTSHSQMIYMQAVMDSASAMPSELTSPIPRMSPQQSPNQLSTMAPQQNPLFAPQMWYDSGMHASQLNSSTNSAFIPIQGSHNDIRYVTPIKPTVTLPNSGNPSNAISGIPGICSNLFIDPNQVGLSEDLMMISPKSQDPPSYETAIMSLRKPGLIMETGNSSDDKNRQTETSMVVSETLGYQSKSFTDGKMAYQNMQYRSQGENACTVSNSDMQERVSLLANMGKPLRSQNSQNHDNFGPFAAKLVQLSRQTKQVSPMKQTVTRSPITGLSTFSDSTSNSNSAIKAALEGPNPAIVSKSYKNDSLQYIPSQFISKDLEDIHQTSGDNLRISFQTSQSGHGSSNIQNEFLLQSDGANSSANLHNEQTLQTVHISTDYHQRTMQSQETEQNNPSFQQSPHSIGQNISRNVLSSNHHRHNDVITIASSHLNERNTLRNEVNIGHVSHVYDSENLDDMDLNEGILTPGQREAELTDEINLTWETLKEIEGQYLPEDAGLYGPQTGQNQQLGEFDMFQE